MEDRGEEGPACAQNLPDAVPSLTRFKRRCFGEDSSEYVRCSKFDCYPMERIKHGQEENAVRIDFEFGVQEQDVLKGSSSKAKRTRCIYLQGNAHNSTDLPCDAKPSDIPPVASSVDRISVKAAKATWSKTSGSGSSSSSPHLIDLDSDEVSEGVSNASFIQDLKDQNKDAAVKKTGECLASDVMEIPQLRNLDPLNTNHHTVMGMTLVDVHLTVQASSRAEDIPFVCLTSQLTGQAILGYPLEVVELSESFETISCAGEENVQSRFHRLVWRTSRRTPVCYVTDLPSSSISKSLQARKATETIQGSIPFAKGGLLINEESLTKYRQSIRDGAHEGQGATSSACIPVELVFSKVLAAVGQVNL